MTFAKQVHDFKLKAEDKTKEQIEFICWTLFTDIVQGTPVDTGRAIGNWQPSIDRPINSTIERLDKTGSQVIASAGPVIEKAAGHIFYITNNLPYIERLEFEPGFAKNKQGGWVRYSIERAKQIASRL